LNYANKRRMRKREYSMEVLATRRLCETPKNKKGKRPSINQRKKERPWNPEKAQKVVEQRLKGNIEKTFALRYDKTEN